MQQITFPEDINVLEIIFNSFKNNSIDEDKTKAFNALSSGKKPKVSILVELIKGHILNKKTTANLIFEIENKLSIKKTVAENILKDIEEPLIKKAKVISLPQEESSPELKEVNIPKGNDSYREPIE